jgi:hypothetical protein
MTLLEQRTFGHCWYQHLAPGRRGTGWVLGLMVKV